MFNLPYWSLSSYLKHSTQRARQFIDDFEETAAAQAEDKEFDGVICGHIHHPRLRTIDGTHYVNTGDWVESCTALVEHLDGRLELLRWIPSGHGAQEAIATEAPFSRDGQRVPAEALESDVEAT
jgi:UDP-2,3-diacylglucosamine pyrophosphatase LpxH